MESQLSEKQWTALSTSVEQLCQVYWGPTEASCRQMLAQRFVQPFETLAPLLDASLNAELAELIGMLEGFSDSAALQAYLEEGYVRLFINDRGGIATPLYASCYEDEDNPSLMGQAAGRMQAVMTDLGIHRSDDVCEPPDHLAIELELLYHLLTRHEESDRRRGLAEAAHFADAFLVPWVRIFHARLARETRCRFYPLMAAVLLSVLCFLAGMPHADGAFGAED